MCSEPEAKQPQGFLDSGNLTRYTKVVLTQADAPIRITGRDVF